jgi:hypothetical protein
MAMPHVIRYALVPERPDERDDRPKTLRRFHLARIAVSPRSATGADRHERMEEVARREDARHGVAGRG